MPIFLSGDPYADFDAYDRYQQEQYDKLPKCHECKDTIEDEHLYDFYGKILCEDCAEKFFASEFKKEVIEYLS